MCTKSDPAEEVGLAGGVHLRASEQTLNLRVAYLDRPPRAVSVYVGSESAVLGAMRCSTAGNSYM